MFAKVLNDQIIQYPSNPNIDNPNVSFPANWNGGTIAPFKITLQALDSPLGQQFQKECVDAYVEWMMANYPILDVGKIMVDNLKVNIKYNLYGDPSGAWNGEYDYNPKYV